MSTWEIILLALGIFFCCERYSRTLMGRALQNLEEGPRYSAINALSEIRREWPYEKIRLAAFFAIVINMFLPLMNLLVELSGIFITPFVMAMFLTRLNRIFRAHSMPQSFIRQAQMSKWVWTAGVMGMFIVFFLQRLVQLE